MWCANSDGYVDLLASSVALDVGRVVGKLIAFAEPDITSCWIVITLGIGNLEDSLDVAQGIAGLVAVDSTRG